MTFFELSVPFKPAFQKGKALAAIEPSERASLEKRIDTIVQLGYSVIAINHVVKGKITAALPDLGLRKREGVVLLKRLTIILEMSGDNTGLTNNNAALLCAYDIIAVQPTSQPSFVKACLELSMAGPLTAHVITLDVSSQSRLPFFLKHTQVRTAVRNGAVFEIPYAGVISPHDENGRRNWWANAREVMRATRGKNVIFSGNASTVTDLRSPLDVANLAVLLGIPQDQARNALSATPRSLVLRSETRKTYRAVLSDPILVDPRNSTVDAKLLSANLSELRKHISEDDLSESNESSARKRDNDEEGVEPRSGQSKKRKKA